MRNSVDWTTVDWNLQDVVLARQLGRTRERVRQVRKQLGKPRPDEYHKRTSGSARLKLAKEATEVVSLPMLAKMTGCSQQRVACVLKTLGKGYKRRPNGRARYDWTRFPAGWYAMTDKAIGAVVGASNPAIVAQYRKRHGYLRSTHKVKAELMYP